MEQRDEDGHHESRLSENTRNLNQRNTYRVVGRHKFVLSVYPPYERMVGPTFERIELGPFRDPSAVAELCGNASRCRDAQGRTWPDTSAEAIERIYSVSHGLPACVQLILARLHVVAAERGSALDRALVDEIAVDVADEIRWEFDATDGR